MTMTSGTKSARTLAMRALVALVLLGGCVGAGSQGASRPAVMPLLSELPADATKRDAVLDSANTVAGPEHRKGMTRKERKVETAAATAAAILGEMFSSTPSVTLGTATLFDEDQLSAPPAAPPPPSTRAGDAARPDAAPANDAGTPNTDLIPWIKLK